MADWEKALRSSVAYFPSGKPGEFLSLTLRLPQVTGNKVVVPYWIPILLSGSVAALPWVKWQFSLRTMLIATTLIAVVLGLVCQL